MKKTALLLFLILFTGCILQSKPPSDLLVVQEGMTIEGFLEDNGIKFDDAIEIQDRNQDGDDDLYIFEFNNDNNPDLIIDLDETIKNSSHGPTFGFNKIMLFNHNTKQVTIAEVGKQSNVVRQIHYQDFN